MPTMIDIAPVSRKDAAIVTLRPGRITINARAAALLGLDCGGFVKVCYNSDEASCGRDRVYIYASATPGYRGVQEGHTFRIYNTNLCRQLVKHLNGYGTYRICEEVTVEQFGTRYYEIFFKRYEDYKTSRDIPQTI